jgi:hypothetical protein
MATYGSGGHGSQVVKAGGKRGTKVVIELDPRYFYLS